MQPDVYCTARDIEGLLGMSYSRQEKLCHDHDIPHFQGRKNQYQQLQRCYTKDSFERLCRAAGWVDLPDGNMAHERYIKDMKEFNKKL